MTAEVPEMGASEDAAAPPVEGEGALWAAAHGGDASEVRRLLANGADPNERGDTARETLSALHWASWKGNADIVAALLAHEPHGLTPCSSSKPQTPLQLLHPTVEQAFKVCEDFSMLRGEETHSVHAATVSYAAHVGCHQRS